MNGNAILRGIQKVTGDWTKQRKREERAQSARLNRRAALCRERGTTIRDAAARMVERRIGSLIVTSPSGEPEGIVTDKDLRRAVAEAEPYDAPVEFIMSSPVAGVPHTETCFDALLAMMRRRIHHLAVTRMGALQGMVTSHDLMVLQGRSPILLFREIMARETIEGLCEASRRVPQVVGRLVEEGAKAGNVTRMIAVLGDLVLERLLTMLQDEMGPPPVPFCWMLMGSEGRKEQTFRTDQDNALIYRDPRGKAAAREAESWFAAFTERAIEGLVACGYPLCPGGMMASNPKWRKSYTKFRDFFEGLVIKSEPEEVLNATIFFDFRPGYGHMEMGESLRDHITVHAARSDVFLRYLAKDCLTARPPLTFFRSFVVEKSGENKNTLDLKRRGLTPFVDFARVFALKHGVKETNTADRLRLLMEEGHLPKGLISEALEAYEFLMQLRLVHQMDKMNAGQQPDNHIDPATLTELEKRTLKQAFGVIGGLQNLLKDTFSLNVA